MASDPSLASSPEGFYNDTTFGFVDRTTPSNGLFNPVLISNVESNTMYKAILEELRRATAFTFSVAFISPDALASLKQAFLEFSGHARIITSTYLGFNSPGTFRELVNLQAAGVEVFVHQGDNRGFHPKGFVFEQQHGMTAIVGSSNLTSRALKSNHEWNLKFSALPDGDIVDQLNTAVKEQLRHTIPLTSRWVDWYEKFYVAPASSPRTALDVKRSAQPIVPNAMQEDALHQIAEVRSSGESKALVISATGTGKTILAALDVRQANPKRMLFVAHREQILDRAIEEFCAVLGIHEDDIGKFVGSERDVDKKYVFATVQTLGSQDKLITLPKDYFDYILIDEVHRAGAQRHRNLIDYFTPDFMLGLTATPERTDGFNIYELFDFNVPYEIRLQEALEEDMLVPFHYYGVTDYESDGEVISDLSTLPSLIAPERVTHLIQALETYGHVGTPVKGLMFCSRKDEAKQLAAILNTQTVHDKLLKTRALTGEDSVSAREEAVSDLEAGRLDYILTVDVFNEGIDIRTVNQVIMLRQTQSSIVFTQQLGRGLRKADGKDYLIVIDFIGNYANNFMVPIALFGDSSLNKDSLRKKMIEAQETGVVPGLSSINFDRIAKKRILDSIAATRLDSLKNIKQSFLELQVRLGTAPRLVDFARFDVADPTVVASARGNYWALLHKFKATDTLPPPDRAKTLTFFSTELLNGKRPHELLILKSLIEHNSPLSHAQCRNLLASVGASSDDMTLASIFRVLTLEFFTESEQAKYGNPVIATTADAVQLSREFHNSLIDDSEFSRHVDDLIETGLYVSRHHYQQNAALQTGKKYSRKDVCRLLNWHSNQQSTIYGYKVDSYSATCPIFVTYDKDEDVAESVSYKDSFINERTLHWFTRSNRTLESKEVRAIVDNTVPLHLFVKKDDAEGTDFYYLGRATSSHAKQTFMAGANDKALNVVVMNLALEKSIDFGLYDYLTK